MKRFLRTTYRPQDIDLALLLMRLGIASMMLVHGLPKLGKFCSSGDIKFADPIGVGVIMSLTLAVFAEVLCSILVLIGLATRLASIPLIITMLVAVLKIHAADPYAEKEKALLYLLVFLVLIITGSGKFSVDQVIMNRKPPAEGHA